MRPFSTKLPPPLARLTAAQKLREERREERKRREVEKKRLRDEEKRRRKVDRERSKDSSVKDFDEEPSQNEAEAKVVKASGRRSTLFSGLAFCSF